MSNEDLPTTINLGPLIGEGGEGRIYAVDGHEKLVVKVYHQPLTEKKAKKLQHMIALAPPQVDAFAAWPLKLMKDKQGAPSAVVMPKIAGGKDVHLLYSPKARRQHFPRADWKFLVHTAQNLAGAFANVHAIGCVIGDVNHGSVLAKDNAQVALIDCDSFQLKVDTELYECEVAVPTFTPPELQGVDMSGRERTPNHDSFGLAVLIFHLLFMGRHPFAGRPRTAGDLSIEQAIKEYRFAFSSDSARVRLDPPPHTLPLTSASPEIAKLFERAFGQSAARPLPMEWHTALGTLRTSLSRCEKEATHSYFNGLNACPWCAIEAASGAMLFYSPQRVQVQQPIVRDDLGIGAVESLWRAIAAVPRPSTPIAMPLPSSLAALPSASTQATNVGAFVTTSRQISYCAATVAGVGTAIAAPSQPLSWAFVATVGFWISKLSLQTLSRKRSSEIAFALNDARNRWQGMSNRWRGVADGTAFDTAFRQCGQLRQEHERLADPIRCNVQQQRSNHAAALQRWTVEITRRARSIRAGHPGAIPLSDAELCAAHDAQMSAYLDRFSIDKAAIPDIGASRKVKLASFGIETAGDVTKQKIENVPGFGSALSGRLMDWRKEVEREFVFSETQARSDLQSGKVFPSQPPANPTPISVEPRVKRRLTQIEAELASAPARLHQLAMTIKAQQDALMIEAKTIAEALMQAEADARAAKVIR